MNNLLEFLFDESEIEEFAIPVLNVTNVMNLEELENLYLINES